jgi:hypothetical protein
METTAFCGTTCHTPMEPEYVAHQAGPHARVECVQCHVGPGAGALIESKLAGARQLLHVVTNRVPKPIPPPEELISPTRDTCERCHRPDRFTGDRTFVRIIREYANDEKNSETDTTLQLYVDGAIHRHMSPDKEIEFVTTGEARDTIPYVRVRDRSGKVREYVADGAKPSQIAAGALHRMDCLDCHNRPAHTFEPTSGRAVDNAIAQGRIPRELPFARREAVAAVNAVYADRDAGRDAIATRLRAFYRARGADERQVERAVQGSQDVWAGNVFPAMKVSWGTYVSQLGHVDGPGCFRCHDDSHKTKDGRVISQDCELCHAMR